jgi:hypothetical protein
MNKARFLVLGSASPSLVTGVSESLAGRVGFVELQGHPKIGASWEGFALERPILLHKRFSAQPATKDILITASYSRSLGGAARAQLPAGGRDVLPLALADDHGEMLAQKDFLEG